MTTPHWRIHPGHSSSSRRHHAGGDQRRFQYNVAHPSLALMKTHSQVPVFYNSQGLLPSQPRAVKVRHANLQPDCPGPILCTEMG